MTKNRAKDMTGKQMRELLQDPTLLKYAYAYDAAISVEHLVNNLMARARKHELDTIVKNLENGLLLIKNAAGNIMFVESRPEEEITYGE